MTLYKELSKIKSPVMLALVSDKTGMDVAYVILSPNGRATSTNSLILDLSSFPDKEKEIYMDMKDSLLKTSIAYFTKGNLKDTLVSLQEYTKVLGLSVALLGENVL